MSTARVDFTRGAAERIAAVVRQVEGGDRDGAPLRFARPVDTSVGGGGTSLRLGRVTAAWSKNTLASVVVYDAGDPLEEEFSAPPLIIESCVNKFADVEAGAFVMLGVAHGRHYMIAAECEVPE
jgi:hypothetical protein